MHVHLVMELCEGKSLSHLVKKQAEQQGSGGISEARAKSILKQILEAVAYMHSQ